MIDSTCSHLSNRSSMCRWTSSCMELYDSSIWVIPSVFSLDLAWSLPCRKYLGYLWKSKGMSWATSNRLPILVSSSSWGSRGLFQNKGHSPRFSLWDLIQIYENTIQYSLKWKSNNGILYRTFSKRSHWSGYMKDIPHYSRWWEKDDWEVISYSRARWWHSSEIYEIYSWNHRPEELTCVYETVPNKECTQWIVSADQMIPIQITFYPMIPYKIGTLVRLKINKRLRWHIYEIYRTDTTENIVYNIKEVVQWTSILAFHDGVENISWN